MAKLSRRVIARTVATQLLAQPAKHDHWVKMAAAYLIDQNRTGELHLLANDIAQELYEQSGKLFADVTSARPLTDAIRRDLKTTLQAATSATHVELAEHVDKDLVGGLIARTPTAELDASVRTALRQLASLA